MRLFNPDSRFMAVFSLFADLVVVNMLMVLSALPVLTAGAALRAGNVVIGQMVRGVGSGYGVRFVRELPRRFAAVTGYWLLALLLAAVLVYQQWVLFRASVEGPALTALQVLALSGALLIAGVAVWFFALGAASRRALADAVVLAVAHLPCTVAALALCLGAVACVVYLPVAWSVPLVFFLLPAFTVYLVRLVLAGALGERLAAD